MKGIVPHLWFDTQEQEAAEFYAGLFENSKIITTASLEGTPSGDSTSLTFELAGQAFMAISAGPYFKFNPSISLMVLCSSEEEINKLWETLSENGKILMPLDEYPFSQRYGCLQDQYGLSWQLNLANEAIGQKIVPALLFSNDKAGKTKEAVEFYTEIFPGSMIEDIFEYAPEEVENSRAKIQFAAFKLNQTQFYAMDNSMDSLEEMDFNEAFSLVILCEDQAELDYYWEKLSAVPEAEQCGWLKDKFGISWQVIPKQMDELLTSGSREQINKVTQAFLEMKKLDIKKLEKIWHKNK